MTPQRRLLTLRAVALGLFTLLSLQLVRMQLLRSGPYEQIAAALRLRDVPRRGWAPRTSTASSAIRPGLMLRTVT